MSRRAPILLGVLVLAIPGLYASSILVGPPAPVSKVEHAPFGGGLELPVAAVNGDRALVLFNHGEGAVRIDAEGKPLDVPAIHLPRPENSLGADVIADADRWLIGWTAYPSTLRLAQMSRDGVIENVRDVQTPAELSYQGPLHLAKRDGVLVVASMLDLYSTLVMTESSHFTLPGALRGLVATRDGFAVLTSSAVVLLNADGSRATETVIENTIAPYDVAADGADLYIAGRSYTGVVLLRLRANALETVADIPAHYAFPSISVVNGEVTLVWVASPVPVVPGPAVYWNLYAARAGDTPQLLRESVHRATKFTRGPDIPQLVRIAGRDLVIWNEGDLYSAPLDAIDQKTLLTIRAVDQTLIGVETFGDVALIVWIERIDAFMVATFARRIGLDGRIIDAEKIPLGKLGSIAVTATSSGFLVAGATKRIRLGVSGPPVEDPDAVLRIDQQCAGEVCAWIENHALVYQRANGTPVAVAAVDLPYRGFAIATNGATTLLVFGRNAGTGTILTAVEIDATSHRFRDFAAAPRALELRRLAWTGDRYLALWADPGVGARGSYLDARGNAIDGPETNWEGWKLPLTVMPSRIASDGAHTMLLTRTRLYELREREPLLVAELDANDAFLACAPGNACRLVTERIVTGDPWFRAARVFTQRLLFSRSRAVRR